ncbi:hypothetical protein NMY22_g653 [Coprinellus aureogranulatus]|nr:hypothetical protein NMY22_g653 [Coprinellus aureogranulatus]
MRLPGTTSSFCRFIAAQKPVSVGLRGCKPLLGGWTVAMLTLTLIVGFGKRLSDFVRSHLPPKLTLKFPQMLDVQKIEELEIPEGVEVTVKSRIISVTGSRGTLTKNSKVLLTVWQGGRKHVACLRTIRTMINNMIIGGFLYKMRTVYAHFPINCIINNEGDAVEIRNFLGEKTVRHVNMLEGVTIEESKAQKDELILRGNDIDHVSQSAASIQGICRVRNKDIRKFLDGIYVSERTTIVQDE